LTVDETEVIPLQAAEPFQDLSVEAVDDRRRILLYSWIENSFNGILRGSSKGTDSLRQTPGSLCP
jgi:hypothetical protein